MYKDCYIKVIEISNNWKYAHVENNDEVFWLIIWEDYKTLSDFNIKSMVSRFNEDYNSVNININWKIFTFMLNEEWQVLTYKLWDIELPIINVSKCWNFVNTFKDWIEQWFLLWDNDALFHITLSWKNQIVTCCLNWWFQIKNSYFFYFVNVDWTIKTVSIWNQKYPVIFGKSLWSSFINIDYNWKEIYFLINPDDSSEIATTNLWNKVLHICNVSPNSVYVFYDRIYIFFLKSDENIIKTIKLWDEELPIMAIFQIWLFWKDYCNEMLERLKWIDSVLWRIKASINCILGKK